MKRARARPRGKVRRRDRTRAPSPDGSRALPAANAPPAAAQATALAERLRSGDATVAVIGLGYVGLPLACEFARGGLRVNGIDVDREKIAQIAAGVSHVQDVPPALLAGLVRSGRLRASAGFDLLAESDAVVICVPTPLRKTRDPDISYIVAAVDAVAPRLHRGMLIVLESTTYPGTTEEVLQPKLEAGGFRVGRDVFLAFSPERVDPGNAKYNTRNTPKIVGGVTPACRDMATALYARAVDRVIPVSSTRAAEMVKLLENTFRSVNIGLVNEVALMCDRLGLDVWEIMDAAATKPFGFMAFYPGPGLGGHCIPIDPHYLSWKLKTLNYQARFIELASDVNSQMPHHVVAKAADALNDRRKSVRGARVLVLGAAYKKDVGDVRESPALDIMKLLVDRGADLRYHDPHVPEVALDGGGRLRSVPLDAGALRDADLVVIVTDHTAFDYDLVVRHAACVLDTRNATRDVREGREKIRRL